MTLRLFTRYVSSVAVSWFAFAALALSSCVSNSVAVGSGAGGESNAIASAFKMKRCVNMGNSLEAPRGVAWGGDHIGHADFKRIHNKGFDTVRIPVRWDDYASDDADFTIEAEFAGTVKRAVDQALANGLNVILNIHHFDGMMKTPDAAMPKFLALWEQIATDYQDYPDTLWFETLNEPSRALKGEIMREAQRRAVEIIRHTNPDRIVILGGEDWSGIRTLDSNIAAPDNNIVYTFHYYDPFDFTHYQAEWTKPNMPDELRGWGSSADRAQLDRDIETAVAYRDRTGRPLFLGEFGVYTTLKDADRNRWIDAVRKGMEEADIPWCLWAYANTFAVYDAEAGQWRPDTIRALGLD